MNKVRYDRYVEEHYFEPILNHVLEHAPDSPPERGTIGATSTPSPIEHPGSKQVTPQGYMITFPPYTKPGVLTFGRDGLAGRIALGYLAENDLSPETLVTTNILDVNAGHIGVFMQIRSGKSTLAASIMLQAAFQGIPVIVMDPKPDYVASVLPFSEAGDVAQGYAEGARRRFNQACQDDRGFNLTRDLPFTYENKPHVLRLRLVTFDYRLRRLPLSQVYRAPLLVLPSLEDDFFEVQCDALATSLASSVIQGAAEKGYNTILSWALQRFKRQNPDRSWLLMEDLIDQVKQYGANGQQPSKKTKRLVDALEGYATETSTFYATGREQATDISAYLSSSVTSTGQSVVPMTVFDISGLPEGKTQRRNTSVGPQAGFVSQVCGQIYNYLRQNRSSRPVQLLLVLDEARNYLPNPTDRYSFVRRLVQEDASLGVKVVLISQSPQDIAMEARKQMKTYVVANIPKQTVKYVVESIQVSSGWTELMPATGQGKALVLGHEVKPKGYALCHTFTSPQFIGLMAPDQLCSKVAQLTTAG